MPTINFKMALTAEQVRTIYEGQTRHILVKSDDGLKVKIPAINFRQFVTAEGIYGRFSLTIDTNHKLKKLVKL